MLALTLPRGSSHDPPQTLGSGQAPRRSGGASGNDTWNVLNHPISTAELTDMPWGYRSYWLQPWRSQLVTRSALSFEDALGMNFKINSVSEAQATARLLAEAGIRRARVEFGWNGMEFADPARVAPQWSAWLTPQIAALRDSGIRPLILLDSGSGYPTPMKQFDLRLRAQAPAGTRTVMLSRASAAQVVPGRTGLDQSGVAAGVLITGVDRRGMASLSRPLPTRLRAGTVAAATLRFAPFAPPRLADGAPNPRFEHTLAGWLAYVKATVELVKRLYGSDDFDVEVWNEVGSASEFLSERNYYSPVPDPGATGDPLNAILAATVRVLANPANGLADVKVGDGFSDGTPFPSGATVPPGTAALDKHPYPPPLNVHPGWVPEPSIRPVDALGQPETAGLAGAMDQFTPTYRVFMPEYYLEGIQTETLMRDLSDVETFVGPTPHGARTHPPGGQRPAVWITEDNMDATEARSNGLPAPDLAEFKAKAALRIYAAYGSEGVQAIDLFGAGKDSGSCCQLISNAFFQAADRGVQFGTGAQAGSRSAQLALAGLPMEAIGRLTATFAGAQPIARPRQLTLDSIAQRGDARQFAGNGTPAFPALYNRDVLAFFPFQVSQNKFVAAVYVMTSDLTHRYSATPAPQYTHYDLPAEQFRLTVGNVNAPGARVSLTDPLTGQDQPVTIVSRRASQITVQLPVTDSPRMLTITDGAAA